MLQYLFDTDHLTLFDHRHPLVRQRFAAAPVGSVGISAVTVQEYLKGRLAALARHSSGLKQIQAYENLVASVLMMLQFPIAPFDAASDQQFQTLRSQVARVGTQDLKIASVGLVNKLVVVTRNRNDFGCVPGLIIDDWSV